MLLRNQDSPENECKLTIQDSMIFSALVRIDHILTTVLWHMELCADKETVSLSAFFPPASLKVRQNVILNH